MRRSLHLLGTAGLLALALAPTATAAPPGAPSNDDRATATVITDRADVRGTTVGASREAGEPRNCPAEGGPSVWYRYTAKKEGEARLLLQSSGGLDATVALYEEENSTATRIACQDTRKGTALLGARLDEGEYLVRVSERKGSASGPFRLRFSGVLVPPRGAGTDLGAKGTASGSLDAFTAPFGLYSRRLRVGRSYRVRVAAGRGERCDAQIELRQPGRDGGSYLGCRDYTVVTPRPGQSGRWTIALTANAFGELDTPFTVSITPVGSDDLAPGRFLGAFGRAGGRVSGRGADAQDVYRFDVVRRAEVTLRLHTGGNVGLRLLTSGGRRVSSRTVSDGSGQLRVRLKPGRFFLVVDAGQGTGGRYRLRRLTRTITATRVSWNRALTGPGGRSTLNVAVSPAQSGRASVTLERFDPQFGWRFWMRRSVRVRGGRGTLSVPTAALGSYRASASYKGSRRASPSRTRRTAVLRVSSPLRE